MTTDDWLPEKLHALFTRTRSTYPTNEIRDFKMQGRQRNDDG